MAETIAQRTERVLIAIAESDASLDADKLKATQQLIDLRKIGVKSRKKRKPSPDPIPVPEVAVIPVRPEETPRSGVLG
jgi:hypothetical protein